MSTSPLPVPIVVLGTGHASAHVVVRATEYYSTAASSPAPDCIDQDEAGQKDEDEIRMSSFSSIYAAESRGVGRWVLCGGGVGTVDAQEQVVAALRARRWIGQGCSMYHRCVCLSFLSSSRLLFGRPFVTPLSFRFIFDFHVRRRGKLTTSSRIRPLDDSVRRHRRATSMSTCTTSASAFASTSSAATAEQTHRRRFPSRFHPKLCRVVLCGAGMLRLVSLTANDEARHGQRMLRARAGA
jgi:hypothetical protein